MSTTTKRKMRARTGGSTGLLIALVGLGLCFGQPRAVGAQPLEGSLANGNLLLPLDGSQPQQELSQTENGLTLINDDASNEVHTSGASERGTTNRMTIVLNGTENAGLGESWPATALVPDFLPDAGTFAPASLAPGTFVQVGANNTMDVSLSGTSNLAAAYQSGLGNMLTATVTGVNNVSAVYQAGSANVAAYNQSGSNNNLGISQTSW